MTCHCLTGSRLIRLRLNVSDLSIVAGLSDLDYWRPLDSGEWSVAIGGHSPYKSLQDLVNFLGAIDTPELLETTQAAWEKLSVAQSCPVGNSCSSRTQEEAPWKRLVDLCDHTASQLSPLLRNRSLTTYFQPVVGRDANSIWGYECLVRGVEADGRVIPPYQLLQWAKSENLTAMLDRVCRENHLRNAARLVPPNKKILINFIPTAIYEPAFCLRSTMAVLDQVALNPHDIIFEVVETEHVRDVQHLSKILDYYRVHGFQTALDDVGAGFSGLNMLACLRPNLLKLDMELVQGAEKSFAHQAIIRGLVQIAKSCDQLILAEGVETKEQFEMMRDFGVDLFQGYLFGRPSPEPITDLACDSDLNYRGSSAQLTQLSQPAVAQT